MLFPSTIALCLSWRNDSIDDDGKMKYHYVRVTMNLTSVNEGIYYTMDMNILSIVTEHSGLRTDYGVLRTPAV
jgi:hypothetical protein